MAGDKPKRRGTLSEAPLLEGADKPHYLGHRERLRQRFRDGGNSALADYELLELILFHAIPRRDLKPLAKELIGKFGSFGGVLGASREALDAAGLGELTIDLLKATHEAGVRLTREAALERPVLGSWQKVLDYCRARLAHSAIEEFHLLFLDRKNGLIAAEPQQRGTVDHTPVYPREVVKRALELGASAVILVHNHVKPEIALSFRLLSPTASSGKRPVSAQSAENYRQVVAGAVGT